MNKELFKTFQFGIIKFSSNSSYCYFWTDCKEIIHKKHKMTGAWMEMILQFDGLNGIREGSDIKCIYFINTVSLFF